MANLERELRQLHFASTEKLTYFLLAGAGASIGFAISLEQALPISWPSIIIIVSVLCWAASFFSGIRSITIAQSSVAINASIVGDIENVPSGQIPRLKEIANEETFFPLSKKMRFWQISQMYSLILGAMFLLFWRIAKGYPNFDPFNVCWFSVLGFN